MATKGGGAELAAALTMRHENRVNADATCAAQNLFHSLEEARRARAALKGALEDTQET